MVDGVRLATVERGFLNITLDKKSNGGVVDILVENQGRLCYGSHGIKYLPDPKGIIGEMRIDSHVLQKWEMFPLDDKVTYSIRQHFRRTTFFDGQNFRLFLKFPALLSIEIFSVKVFHSPWLCSISFYMTLDFLLFSDHLSLELILERRWQTIHTRRMRLKIVNLIFCRLNL